MSRSIESDVILGSTRVWTYSAWMGLGLYAWGVVIAGAVLPEIASAFGLTPAVTGGLIALPAVGFTLAGLLGGYLSNLLGLQLLLVLSTYGLASGLGLASVSHTAEIFGVALFLVGLSGGMFEVGSNGIIAGMYPEAAGRELNRLHIFFGVGAFLSPLVVAALLIRGIPWQTNYIVSACMVLFLAVYLTFQVRFTKLIGSQASMQELFGLVGKPAVLLAWLGALLFVASELGFSNWVATYLRMNTGFTPEMASYGLSLFWLSMLLGRYLNILLPHRFKDTRVIFFEAACGAAALTLTLSAYHSLFVFFGIALVGLFMAGILPWVLAYANRACPGYSGTTSGFVQIGTGAGMLLGPALIGVIYGATSIMLAMYISVILLIILAAVFVKAD